jgi:hypothetical protein
MAFNIDFSVSPVQDITALEFTDNSTNPDGETILSKVITIIKPDLSSTDYPFAGVGDTTLTVSGILDKDYALEAVFSITTTAQVDPYVKTLRFATLNYAIKGRIDRVKRAKVDKTILDMDLFDRNTVKIANLSVSASDRVIFGDILGSQDLLDEIADVMAKEALSPFSV